MKSLFKWTGLILGSFLVLLLVFYAYVYFKTTSRFNKAYTLQVPAIVIPTDSASIAKGYHLAAIKGCNDCHGSSYSGKVVIDDPALGLITAPNITRGQGGLTTRHTSYTDADYVRAIKHGLNQENKSLKLMPSYEYNSLSNQDMGALIAYIKRVPPVDNEMPEISLGPMAYVLTHLDQLPLVSAEKIDHTTTSQEVVHPEITPAYGQYVAVSCTGCHRDNFKGGDALVPGSPTVPNITGTGMVGKWSEAQFIQTLKTGVTPEGKKLNPQYMPWKMTQQYTDVEIKSLYLYLKGITA